MSDPARRRRRERALVVLAPLVVAALVVVAWDRYVVLESVPPYILPGPGLVARTLVADWGTLLPSLLVTLEVTAAALVTATVGGVLLAVLFSVSRWIEASLYPYAVILQVTPMIAVAPLVIIYVEDTRVAILICAWIVAFFPVLSSTTIGLASADRNLVDLYRLYGASRLQEMWLLRLPAALPYILSGLRIAGGLSLIGAIVAEFAAGTAGAASGLAYRILEAGYRLNIPRLFAALLMVSLTGIAIFFLLSLLSRLLLRHWHESALPRDR